MMKKILKKLFIGSNAEEVGEKITQKSSSSRSRSSMSNIIKHVRHSKFNSLRSDGASSSPSSFHEEPHSSCTSSLQAQQTQYDFSEKVLQITDSKENTQLAKESMARGNDTEITDVDNLSPFLKAVRRGNIDLVKVFVQENKFETDANGNTALHIAVEQEFLRIAEILVSHDPLVNVPNKVGDLPLHIAISKECLSIVELLLSHNAVLDVEDSHHRTPLFIAVKLENIPLIHMLLKYGANRNDRSFIAFVSSSHNLKLKALFRPLQFKENLTSVFNDDDSQHSEQYCVLPPVLSSPRSWNVLHPKENGKCCNAEKNASDLIPFKSQINFTRERDSKIKKYLEKSTTSMVNLDKSNQIQDNSKVVVEDCRKALDELSLQINKKQSSSTLDETENSVTSVNEPILKEDMKSQKNSADNCENDKQNVLFHSCATLKESSSSSEEELFIWENSNDGGYFTEWSHSSKLSNGIEAENQSKSSSDEELDNHLHQKAYSTMLTSLKQATQDNKDLETETAVLRESVEKLKYDLANSREEADFERLNASSVMLHMGDIGSKYSKAIENSATSQLYIMSLEKEISHLKRMYNESCKMNRFLAKELRKSLADVAQIKSKCQNCVDSSVRIGELQAELAKWECKYEESTRSYEDRNAFNPHGRDLLDLHSDICHTYDKIKQCLLQSDVSKISDSQLTVTDEQSHNIIDETDRKMHLYLSKFLKSLEEKVAKCDPEAINDRTEEIMKQKLLLEVSKLNSILKDKDIKEEQLRSQVQKLREEIQKTKREKRKMLIRKTFREKYGFSVNQKYSIDSVVNFDST